MNLQQKSPYIYTRKARSLSLCKPCPPTNKPINPSPTFLNDKYFCPLTTLFAYCTPGPPRPSHYHYCHCCQRLAPVMENIPKLVYDPHNTHTYTQNSFTRTHLEMIQCETYIHCASCIDRMQHLTYIHPRPSPESPSPQKNPEDIFYQNKF